MSLNAFPEYENTQPGGYHLYPGMTLRDYFASQVMPVITRLVVGKDYYDEHETRMGKIARLSYEIADSMIAEREKQK